MNDQPTTPHPGLEYDPETGAIYLNLSPGSLTEESVEVEVPNAKTTKKIVIDLDKNGEIIGIEILP